MTPTWFGLLLLQLRGQDKPRKPPQSEWTSFYLDNSGFELFTDLVLADFLVSSRLAREVHFHGKCFPWFVSDVTANDFQWTIRQTVAANHKWMSKSGVQWKSHLKEGVWSYHDHPFWTQPHEFCDMEADAPDLYATLQGADLVLFKGDLNYRKLTGDREWAHTVGFNTALRGFAPAPLCSLRTLKANVQVGLQPGQGETLSSQDPDWMTSSKYAVIQFSSSESDRKDWPQNLTGKTWSHKNITVRNTIRRRFLLSHKTMSLILVVSWHCIMKCTVTDIFELFSQSICTVSYLKC